MLALLGTAQLMVVLGGKLGCRWGRVGAEIFAVGLALAPMIPPAEPHISLRPTIEH